MRLFSAPSAIASGANTHLDLRNLRRSLFATIHHVGKVHWPSIVCGCDYDRSRCSPEPMGFEASSVPSWSERIPDSREPL
jgi:hypothetical protein